MPKPLTWKKLKCKGEQPNPRYGHTMVEMDKGLFVLFGGLDNKRKNGKIMPNNEVYSLKIQPNGEAYWNMINCEGEVIPLPRSNHSACKINKNLMFVFGGLYSSNQRFNDVHLLKTVTGSKKYTWTQPKDQKPIKTEPKNTQSKIGAPAPRANCTSSFIPEQKKIYVIGGHGGEGYSRKSFIDIHTFDCETHEWTKIDAIGSSPRERGGHSANVLPNSQQIFIYGGWNSITQFEDFFIFNCENREWIDLDTSSHDTARWSHSSILVPALPNWKLFIFGGSNEDFDEGSVRKFAELSNTAAFIDIKADLKQSRWTEIEPVKIEETCFPSPRENTSMVYEAKNNRLIVFGGWANRYKNDIYELNISSITGPLYAVYEIEPDLGPYTGSTQCVITGEGFIPNTRYIVEFNAGKGEPITTVADYVSKTQIKCETPDFTTVGAKPAEVRVRANDDDLTLTHVNFKFYLNTEPGLSIAFGPGLLGENKTETDTVFYIQTRNKHNLNRNSGRDKFEVVVYTEKEIENEDEEGEIVLETIKEEIPSEARDIGNGQYEVIYKHEKEEEVKIDVLFENHERKMEPIRGSPFIAGFKADAPEENNQFTGPQMSKYIDKRLKEISSFIKKTSKGIDTDNEKYKTDREALIVVKKNTKKIEAEKAKTNLDLQVIEQALKNFEVEDQPKEESYAETKNMIKDMEDLEEDCIKTEKDILDSMKNEKKKCEEELSEFVKELKRYFLSLGKMEIYTNYEAGVAKSLEDIADVQDKIDEYKTKLDDFDRYTDMFSIEEGTGEAKKFLDKIITSKKGMSSLWEHIKLLQDTFETYLKLEWKDLEAEEMGDQVKSYQKQLTTMKNVDRKSNAYQGINNEIKNWIHFLPLIGEMKDSSMTVNDDRHWEAMRDQLNIDFVLDEETKLEKFWNMGIYAPEPKTKIEDITDRAKQERKIELKLEEIEGKWNDVKFLRTPIEMKEGTIETIKLDDNEVELLEDHQLQIQNMAANKFMGYFKEKVEYWQEGLSAISDTMQLMSEVQKTWSFLINLFIYSEEVKKELPDLSRDFIEIDKKVNGLLENSKSNEVILEFCIQEYEGDKILAKLEEISSDLGKCQKGLNEFIASKRKVFPRFYFLTMEELLDILANGNNPQLLFEEKNYMNKIVQAIDNLKMKNEGDRPRILSLKSSVGTERVEFLNNGIKLVGKVEIYLQDVLKCIKDTIHKRAEESRKEFKTSGEEKLKWIVGGLAQLNLLTNAIIWVNKTEETFNKLSDDSEAMSNFLGEVKGSLNELITYVQGKLEKPVRKKMMCLITIETHNRDVIEKLVRDKVIKADAFQWQSQLKFYYNKQKDDVNIRIADASLWYSYEYLGNGSRLVVTDLTDRIYVTATQALHLKMGCAPAGPAGTGKTETTKDLSAAVGKPCYVFNCSPEMDYITMGNTFKGLASSGAWGCFDEFNRLKPEVLSVCTVQFKSVLDAIKAGVQKFKMDSDDELDLDPTCGAFITMNPGYIGRATLPEGLKALFRPITVVVPDLELICENILMAEGFHKAKILARKFTTLYSLSSDLLSDQPHYDWGLRAIKSVLVVAGEFKRNDTVLNDEGKLLFRALRDSNDPKIAQVDKGIFKGLLDALFPGCEDVARERDMDFEKIIEKVIVRKGLTPHPEFVKKVVQLKELMAIRHCVFIMGPSASGRTSTYQMLADAQTEAGEKTFCQDIDPKCVSTRDLYGYTNMITKEWKNGLLSHFMQYFSEMNIEGKQWKWIILDGDLDANWIESMNSVMDDNKLLTLANNGRIILRDYMKMLFEIRDLRFATLATVTRAGIIYISDDSLYQLDCYYDSWVRKMVTEHEAEDKLNVKDPEDLNHLGYILNKFKKTYLYDTVDRFKKEYQTVIPISYHAMTVTLCKLLHHMIRENMKNIRSIEEKEVSLDEMKLEALFCLAAVWAFGGALTVKDNIDYRKRFSDDWKSKHKRVKFPSTGTVFDYDVIFDGVKTEFIEWKNKLEVFDYDSKIPMKNITIPIPETLSIKSLTKKLILMNQPVMYIGNSGAGKTQLIKGLLKEMRSDYEGEYYFTSISFNYYTDSDYLRPMLEQELVKQGNRYGPKKGGNHKLIYFIDDLNMPNTDKFDTQSSIALLRQHIDYGHWYDISKAVPMIKQVINTQVITAMNPTSGSFFVNPRYQRHFWISAIPFPENNSLIIIYETFLKGHFAKFKPEILILSAPLIKAAISLHDKVVTNFRKTAANFHYEFNIRHLSDIFSGVLQSKPEHFTEAEKIIKLWIHESERIYSDRLVSREHIEQYNKLSIDVLKSSFGKYTSIQKFYSPDRTEALIFNDFPQGYQGDRYYSDVKFDLTVKYIEEALEDYNNQNAEMALVLFEDAIKHVCRITRIVSESGGHALLVGVGGSGKQSLTKLAAYIKNLSVDSIKVSNSYGLKDLKDQLQVWYKKCGEKDNAIMLLITDSQITDEKFLVYINDLLASGEIADLFTQDDKIAILNNINSRVKADGIEPTPDNKWAWYINKIRENLHVSLCFSPVGETFAARARKFPGLITATVIDWFHSWPEIALKKVAKMKLEETLMEIDIEKDSEMMERIIDFIPFSFEVVNQEAIKIYKSDRRHIHNTPKTFLELVALFKKMLLEKREGLIEDKNNYELGLSKLNSTEEIVKELEAFLEVKNVEVKKKKEDASKVAEVVGKEKATVEEENKKATAKEKECSIINIEVQKQKEDCESDVKKLEPMVKEALSKVEDLDPKSIGEVRGYKKAPPGVDKVFICIMYMFAGVPGGYDVNITLKKNKTPKDLSWKGCLTLIKDAGKILKDLMRFPKEIQNDNVPKQNFKLMEPYFKDPIMQSPKKMKKKSVAAAAVLDFLISMRNYYSAMKQMIPKREKLNDATVKLANAQEELAEVREQVAKLNAELEEKVTELNRVEKIRDDAQAEADKCNSQLSLATRLVNALSSEKVRWADSITSLDKQINVIIGDVILASSFISYAGPFTKKFRQHMMEEKFKGYLRENEIKISENLDTVNFLVDDAIKAEWNNEGLPNDKVSIENGTILMNSERYPLMIDPQLQGITWIKKKLKDDGLISMRTTKKNYTKILERCIADGVPVMLENLDDNIDAIIFPVIARKIIKKNHKLFMAFGGQPEVHPDFRLYMQTKMSNPHYPPEIQAEAALINFTVTEIGLSDQLLSLVVSRERPDLEITKIKLIKEQNKFKITLKELETDLLNQLTSANDDNLLENIELIENLEKSKALSEDIKEKVKISKITEQEIIASSEMYRSTAVRGALIFFLMNELYKMSSFYMYSLESFVNIINLGIDYVTEEVPEEELKKEEKKKEEKEEEGEEKKEEEVEEKKEEKEEGEEKKEEEGEKKEEAEGEEEAEEEASEGEEEGEEEAEDLEIDEPKSEEMNIEDLNVKILTPRSLEKRVDILTKSITFTAFENVRRGLFEKHKLIFAALLTFRILMKSEDLEPSEVDHLIVGKQIDRVSYPQSESLKSYVNEKMYKECKALENHVGCFDGLCDSLVKDHLQWKKWFQAEKAEEAELPKEYKGISFFHKMMLIRALRPDRMTYTLRMFVIDEMGREYIEQPPFDMEKVYLETSKNTPVFFVLFPGVNPTPEVERVGLKKGITADKLMDISMGQGQEERAIDELKKACEDGTWIFLQNVHLMETWIKLFERKLEEFSEDAHENFRCFISSEQPPKNDPTKKIVPEAILQRCIKISNEAPSDLVSNMRRAYSKFSEERIKNAPQPNVFKSILFGLCYFHAVVLGRKKFGSAGWSKVYNFNDGDLTICADVLENYLKQYEKVPYDDLRYIYGEIMYGGHITDDWDRRTNNTYLEVLITPELMNKANIIPSQKKIVRVPDPAKSNYQDYWELIEQFQDERPYMFGMHSNAEINFLTNQCDYIFNTIIDIRGDSGAVGAEGDSGPGNLVAHYLDLPKKFNLLILRSSVIEKNRTLAGVKTASPDDDLKFPPGPFQNVALQECETMTKLLHEMESSLIDLKLGLQGDLNMTEAMDKLATSILLERVPDNWAVFYSSKKPLPSWYEDMKERYEQLRDWTENFERPLSLCISYLFNPMSFLTAVMQVKAKEHNVALDSVCLNTLVTKFMDPQEIESANKSTDEYSDESSNEEEEDEHKDSVFIHGLFLEGASWESNTRVGYLTEMKPNELHPIMPVIGVQAIRIEVKSMRAQYECPVYYTTFRGPTFVFTANLNMESDDNKERRKWILAGVAMIMNEDF